jgi:hypothetical protein
VTLVKAVTAALELALRRPPLPLPCETLPRRDWARELAGVEVRERVRSASR